MQLSKKNLLMKARSGLSVAIVLLACLAIGWAHVAVAGETILVAQKGRASAEIVIGPQAGKVVVNAADTLQKEIQVENSRKGES